MSAIARNQVFSAVHTIGGLIPADMLVRISEGRDVSGSTPADYRVFGSRSVRDEAERHWDYLRSVWAELRGRLPVAPEAETPADPTGLAVRQWLEPLFAELGFGRLTPVGAPGLAAEEGGKTFPISHRWQHVPIHLIPWNASLDRRPGGTAGTVPPQSMVQEFLNRSQAHLWGVLSNGRQLRLLRDSSALATAAYVEFDLEAIFDGELFSEFVLLYRLLHVSRFEVAPDAPVSTCWLERWRTEAIESGVRAVRQLRNNVREAIGALGTGFLRHPSNNRLRKEFEVQSFHHALLRLVYRLLFLFVAEDRGVLHDPKADEQAKQRYAVYFSSARLRAQARRRRGTAHSDLYQTLRIVLEGLGNEDGNPRLGLPGLGGLFNHTEADEPLAGLALSNEYLLTAIRHLSLVRDASTKRWRSIDYRNLDAEELGSIYESLLELVPKYSAVDRRFELVKLPGNPRKTTGSYYTPSPLIDCLLDSALDPVIDDAVKRGEQAAAKAGQPDPSEAIVSELLSLTVCDPACGSGHFLVAAARRIAKRVAAVRERNPEPTVGAVAEALRDVISRCIYGVDVNPMAVELAKVSLWMEAMVPGKALTFLDAHIKCGNSLIGATPALLRKGIPDAAFKPIEGDDKKFAKALEKQNAKEREGQLTLFDAVEESGAVNVGFAQSLRRITAAPSQDLAEVRRQEAAYRDWLDFDEYRYARHIANAWCAAFLWRKTPDAPPAVTYNVLRTMQRSGGTPASPATHEEIERLAEQYRFFHWHLEFPEVFRVPADGTGVNPQTGWAGGFDCVLGNPPWEHLELKEQEFFAANAPSIAKETGARRKKAINALRNENPALHNLYESVKRNLDGQRHFASHSGLFPLCGRGRIKTDSIFVENSRKTIAPEGRLGMIVPTGIATDATTQFFFRDLTEKRALVSLYDFRNSGFFADVAGAQGNRFCLLTLQSKANATAARMAFRVTDIAELQDPNRVIEMHNQDIQIVNPNTGTAPIFYSRRDAEITLGIYRRAPVLIKENDPSGNPWQASFMQGQFNSTSDSNLFNDQKDLETNCWIINGNIFQRGTEEMLPLYEAKMFHHYNHRFGDYAFANLTSGKGVRALPTPSTDALDDPSYVVQPRYWVADSEVDARLRSKSWNHDWLIAWRDVTSGLDERTLIVSVLPRVAAPDGTLLILPVTQNPAGLLACLSSFPLDFVARQKVGGTHIKFFTLYQLPVLTPEQLSPHIEFITRRVLELTYTAYDIAGFARHLGDTLPPFRWIEERREIIRAELDALFFHLYGIARPDVEYIMDTFPIIKRKDEARYGSYRTKELILAAYDRMATAGVSLTKPLVDGKNYVSTLSPAPRCGPRHPENQKVP